MVNDHSFFFQLWNTSWREVPEERCWDFAHANAGNTRGKVRLEKFSWRDSVCKSADKSTKIALKKRGYQILFRTGMEKVMATVFAFNEKSLGFFHKLGYETDVTCPDENQGRDYLILSKTIS